MYGVVGGSGSGTRGRDDQSSVRVLTWNLGGRHGDWQRRQSAISSTLRDAAPDVLTLQAAWKTDAASQVLELGKTLDLPYLTWSPNRRPETYRALDPAAGLEVGNAVLSRWPHLHSDDLALPAAGWPESGRTAVGAVVDHPCGLVPIITTHLMSHPAGSAARVQQVEALVHFAHRLEMRCSDLASGEPRFPVLVTGDMNAEPSSDELRKLGGLLTAPSIPGFVLADSWRLAGEDDDGWTWRRQNPLVGPGSPNARIDYVLVGMNGTAGVGRVLARGLIGTGPVDGTWPSTHAGVWVELSTGQRRGTSA